MAHSGLRDQFSVRSRLVRRPGPSIHQVNPARRRDRAEAVRDHQVLVAVGWDDLTPNEEDPLVAVESVGPKHLSGDEDLSGPSAPQPLGHLPLRPARQDEAGLGDRSPAVVSPQVAAARWSASPAASPDAVARFANGPVRPTHSRAGSERLDALRELREAHLGWP